MSKQLKLILRETPTGLEPTQKQSAQRKRFAQAAKEVAQEMKGTTLKGAARVKAFNAGVSERLKAQ